MGKSNIKTVIKHHEKEEKAKKKKVQKGEKKEKKRKARYSNFFITINTNQKLNPESKEAQLLRKKLKKSLNDIFNNMEKIVEFKDDKEAKWDDTFIKSVNIESVIETGPKNNAIHCHFLITIHHKTTLKLNFGKIKKIICDGTKLKNIYINNRNYYSSGMNLRAYLKKTLEEDSDDDEVKPKKKEEESSDSESSDSDDSEDDEETKKLMKKLRDKR